MTHIHFLKHLEVPVNLLVLDIFDGHTQQRIRNEEIVKRAHQKARELRAI